MKGHHIELINKSSLKIRISLIFNCFNSWKLHEYCWSTAALIKWASYCKNKGFTETISQNGHFSCFILVLRLMCDILTPSINNLGREKWKNLSWLPYSPCFSPWFLSLCPHFRSSEPDRETSIRTARVSQAWLIATKWFFSALMPSRAT